MRRAALIAVAAVVTLAACGGDDESADDSTLDSSPTSGDDASTDGSEPTDLSLVTIAPPTTVAPPEVELPEAAPTELGRTVITEGAGLEAAEGDGVLVRYVGVSFDTGEQFDSNFGGGEPLPVVLGQGRVIAGWEEGLIGVQAGERLQLDIPADLAYGPAPSETTTAGTSDTTAEATDTTVAGTAAEGNDTGVTTADSAAATSTTMAATSGPPTGPLTFVIDVLAVVPPTDPATAPTDDDIPTLCPRPVTETTTADTTDATDGTTASSADTTATTAAGWRRPAATDDTTVTTAAADTTAGSAGSDTTDATNGTCDVHVDEVVTDDLVVGDGPTASLGQVAIMHFTLARADNGVVLRSSWDDGQPTQLVLQPGAEMSGMITGIEGMQVGGRRVITVPYLEAFGERGFPTSGLPAETDVVVVVDLLGVYS